MKLGHQRILDLWQRALAESGYGAVSRGGQDSAGRPARMRCVTHPVAPAQADPARPAEPTRHHHRSVRPQP